MRINPGPERARKLAEDAIPPRLPELFRLFLPLVLTGRGRAEFSAALGLLVRLSLPAMVGMIVQSAYYFVDRVFVGQALDPYAVAGITIAFPYMQALQGGAMLIGIGAAALVSIRLGEKKTEEAERVLGNAVTMLFIATLLLTVVGEMALWPMLRHTDCSPEVRQYAYEYLQILVLAIGFQFFGYGLNAIIRSEGDTRSAMWTLLIGVMLNCVLAPLFLFGFRWGMRGAAIATAISQAVSAAWVVAYFVRGRSTLHFHWRLLRLHGATCVRILLYGSPMFVMMMFAALMLSIVNAQANYYGHLLPLPNGGAMALAIWGSIYTLFMVSNMPIYGINQGTQPVVGFNFGAGRFDRVKQALVTGIGFASLLTVFGFVVAMVLPGPVLGLFINAESADRPQFIAVGIRAMRICFLLSPLLGFQAVSAGYFQAVGKPREATLLMLSRQVFLLIPMALILPRFFGLDGVWMALPVSDFLSSLITGVCLFFELRHLDNRHQQATAAAESRAIAAKAAENIGEPCA